MDAEYTNKKTFQKQKRRYEKKKKEKKLNLLGQRSNLGG